ncbi:receptor-interacting serine/threonine-protein kinase 3-like [Bombina bombina]|uniref:receptor-interacting serine/threonine-protein kinase 3-like n=1 Tax=Bombina bombina TaxID=8345 RepID=UPI00235B1020|nr:receptor-interacting serine/threonine-protein kinase 3-like [Bombina bombina]
MLQLPAGDLDNLSFVNNGGFGNIYRGWSRTLKMDVAFKTINGAACSNLKMWLKKIKKEGDMMLKANHTYVLLIFGMYENEEENPSECGLILEYMPCGSVRSLLDDLRCIVPWALRFQILHQVCLGMNYLHNLNPPIIHRDLKPSNVLLNRHLDVQITDFGLSKIIGASSSTKPKSFVGTLPYMPPEAFGDLNYKPTEAFDIYSYGILIWTVFSGEEPYNGALPTLIQRKVPEGQRPSEEVLDKLSNVPMVPNAKQLMIQCWHENPNRRPSFAKCSDITTEMFEVYKSITDNAVRSVQDKLKTDSSGYESEDSEECTSSSLSTLNKSYFEFSGDGEESIQSNLVAKSKEKLQLKEAKTSEDDDAQSPGFLFDKLSMALKEHDEDTIKNGTFNDIATRVDRMTKDSNNMEEAMKRAVYTLGHIGREVIVDTPLADVIKFLQK